MKYPTCKLAHVTTPGKYSVVTTDKEHVSEVFELENRLKKEMIRDNSSEFELCNQMCVAVIGMDEKFRRGVIERKLTDDFYQVSLIDYGCSVHVNKSKMRVITNKDFMKVEPLGFVVKLYGLIPIKYVFVGRIKKHKVCKEWRPESKAFVEDLFKENHKIVVKSILIQDRTVYGDLLIQLKWNTKFLSLRQLLCKNGFCVYSESIFLRQEQLETSSDVDSELDEKMQFVEKWQKENFGTETNSLQPLAPVLNSENNGTDISSPNISASEYSCERSSGKEHQVPEATPVPPKTLGMGRGRIQLLAAQMKNKEGASGGNSSVPSSFQKESNDLPEIKKSLGRGQFLKKYLEIKKLKSEDERPLLSTSTSLLDSTEGTSERFSDVEKPSLQDAPKAVSKVEKATIKPEDSSELSDSNEVSLSMEEIKSEVPPLVESGTVEKNFGSEIVRGRSELKKSSPDIRANSAECLESAGESLELIEKGEKSVSVFSRSTNLGESMNGKYTWKQTRSQFTSIDCWTPYVRFDDCVVEPVKTFGELPIQPSVIKNLKRGGRFNLLSQVQRWAIPAIRKQLNTIIIGSCKTGKTLSYVVPLMDYVQDESYFEELPHGNGPSVVIVASSSRICTSIYNLCCSLVGHMLRHKVKIVLAHGAGGSEEEVWVKLTNGCDVLISTPHCLVRLLEMPVVTNFERLTCLVVDEIDIITENPFRKNVRILFEKAQFITQNRYYQKILCGEKWTPNVENLVKTYLESYALVIGSYSEAAIYEGLKPSLYLVDQNQKKELVLDKLQGVIGKSKIVIVCEKTSEAVSLNDFLSGKGMNTLLAHENMLAEKLKGIRRKWKSLKDSVLVITDGILNELNVREAQTLVHYGLPSKSKTNFYLRYFTFENFLRNEQKFSKAKDKRLNDKLEDIILIDDENHYQLPHIVEFVVLLGGKVPEKIVERCQDIRRLVEVQKCYSPMCENVLAFGHCRNWKSCPQRHVFVQSWDSPNPGSLPTSGWVNFVLLRIHDASSFSVRLTDHTDPSGKTSKLEDHYLEVPLKLAEFYKNESNRRPHAMPSLGDVCAVKQVFSQGEVFYRAKIIEYLKVDKYEKPLEVRVKLIDQGYVWRRKNFQLYELPEELSNYPPAAVDVRIVGLQPLDFDISWSEVATEFTKTLMSQKLEESQYWSGKIVLALNNTLFLDPIRRKEFLPQLNIHVFDLVVRDELLNNRVAVANDEHLPSLKKLCSEGGIEVEETEEIQKEDSTPVQPQWAFLDLTNDLIPVRFLAAENTSVVFLQIKKFEKLLRELEEDCHKEGTKVVNEIKNGKMKMAVGMFCLALFEDGKWNRGRIESEKEDEFCVYFVDHGDFLFVPKSNVLPISQSLLLRLPCQAIECSLAGIEEKEECPLEVLKKIYGYSDDGKKVLYACVVRKDLKPNVTGGRKYCLNLIDGKGVSLNKMLIDCGMVSVEESEREHLKDVDMGVEEVSDEGEDEEEAEEEEEEKEEEGLVKVKEESQSLKFLDDYTINMEDGVFEDEAAQEFLKEFASKIFNLPGAEEGNTNSPVSGSKTATDAAKESSSKPIQNLKQPADLHQKPPRKELELKGKPNVFTPQVLWCQNQVEIQVKILLGNVTDYSLECSVSNVSFRCLLEDRFYSVDLRLYGAINPGLTKVTPKTFHVVVVLTKLAFPLWPRLHLDEGRFRWINLDVESLNDKEQIFSEKVRSAKLEIESGAVKKGIRSETILPFSDSDDSDVPNVNCSDSEDNEDQY